MHHYSSYNSFVGLFTCRGDLSCSKLILVVLARNYHVFTHVTDKHNWNPQGLCPTSLHGPHLSYANAELMITLLLVRLSWHNFLALATTTCPPKIGGPRDADLAPLSLVGLFG